MDRPPRPLRSARGWGTPARSRTVLASPAPSASRTLFCDVTPPPRRKPKKNKRKTKEKVKMKHNHRYTSHKKRYDDEHNQYIPRSATIKPRRKPQKKKQALKKKKKKGRRWGEISYHNKFVCKTTNKPWSDKNTPGCLQGRRRRRGRRQPQALLIVVPPHERDSIAVIAKNNPAAATATACVANLSPP